MFRTRLSILTCALAVIGSAVFIWKKSAQVDAASTIHFPVESAATDGRDQTQTVDSAQITVGAYLANYFGTRWDDVRQATGLSPRDLEILIDPALIPPWEDVEPQMLADLEASCLNTDDQVVDALKWDDAGRGTNEIDFSAPAFNPAGKVLRPSDIAAIRAAVKTFDDDIRDLAAGRALSILPALKSAFNNGQSEKAPIVRVMPNRLQRGHVCALKILVAQNWNVVLGFIDGDSPEYDAANALINETRRARFEKAREVVAAVE